MVRCSARRGNPVQPGTALDTGAVGHMVIEPSDLSPDQLADAWRQVRNTSPVSEADPFVLHCARRLMADPWGEKAHVWVSGLVTMSGYLAWHPGREAEHAALDALRAAGGGHGRRPVAA
ncbi:hypothetical protein AB0O68_16160 [Streptomyces sp. NPDC087512]|uniref:hypothetical protein n=1 Tax=Streptomyces sp. NPDC087512 TaxID=3155059 RepID=UPI00341827B6